MNTKSTSGPPRRNLSYTNSKHISGGGIVSVTGDQSDRTSVDPQSRTYVHDEVKQLGNEIYNGLKEQQRRTFTTEAGLLDALTPQQFRITPQHSGARGNQSRLTNTSGSQGTLTITGRQGGAGSGAVVPSGRTNGGMMGMDGGIMSLGGPSEEIKGMFRKEEEGSRLAMESGMYFVYRCVPETDVYGRPVQKKGASQPPPDQCYRLGPNHRCFCGCPLSSHLKDSTWAQNSKKSSDGEGRALPPCADCEKCAGFWFIPNQPEEIGEGWLSRRKNFDLSKWSAKCRCGHGAASHALRHPSKSTLGRPHLPSVVASAVSRATCRECACRCFEGHFACAACDQPYERHVTTMESREDRLNAGRTVDAAFQPLKGVDSGFRQVMGLDGAHDNAHYPPDRLIEESPSQFTSKSMSSISKNDSQRQQQQQFAMGVSQSYDHTCTQCGAVFRTKKKFCSSCGVPL